MSVKRRGYKPLKRTFETEAIPCTYCGLPADNVDHIVPTSLLAMIDGLSAEVRDELLSQLPPLMKVYACGECNRALSNRLYRTITNRRLAAKAYLKRKYARLLRMPDWDEDEIEELGPMLSVFVRNNLVLRDEVRERVRWKGRR